MDLKTTIFLGLFLAVLVFSPSFSSDDFLLKRKESNSFGDSLRRSYERRRLWDAANDAVQGNGLKEYGEKGQAPPFPYGRRR